MKFLKFIPALLAAAALSLCACGGEDPDEPGTDPGNSGTFGDKTPEEVKEQLAGIASSVLDKFNPEDQEELVNFVDYLSRAYGDVEFEEEGGYYSPMRRVAKEYDEIIDIVSAFPNGVYTPVGGKWTKTEDSKDVVLRIPNDSRYGRVELTVKQSGKQNVEANVPEEGSYLVTAPTSVEGTLTANGKTMVSEKLTANLNTTAKTLEVSETTTAANVVKTIRINAGNSQATATTSVTVGGSQIVNATGTLNGRNLCDINKIAQAVYDENIESFFSGATISGNVIGQLFINGSVKAIGEVMNAYGKDYSFGNDEWYEYSSLQQAANACSKAVDLINRNVNVGVSFAQNGPTEAALTFIVDEDFYTYTDWNGNVVNTGWYSPMPALKFGDGTTYTDDFFEYGFDAVINQFETLVEAYERLVD